MRYKSINREEVSVIDMDDSQMAPIMDYLEIEQFPDNLTKTRKSRGKVAWYDLLQGELYKRRYVKPLLKCVTKKRAGYIIEEIYEGYYG